MKNLAKSIRDRLLNIAKNENISFQLVVLRYFHERFLFRLSQSPYKENFYLKGGVLLYSFSGIKTRPTIDIDFAVKKLHLSPEKAIEIFRSVCSIEYSDGVVFDTSSITVKEIIEQGKYQGLRIKILTKLDTIKQPLQIDLGVGDVFYPKAIEITYPTLLDFEKPIIYGISIYTAIAEKFEAMIWLSEINSRMKDFYDVFILLKTQTIDKSILKLAIKKTFNLRETPFRLPHSFFDENFVKNSERLKQWQAFLKRNNLDYKLSFYEVWKTIKDELFPLYQELAQN